MADPRYFELDIGVMSPTAALQEVRRVLAACAEPPISRQIVGTVSRESIAAIADLLPAAQIEADLTIQPSQIQEVAEMLQDLKISWFARQKDSGFGSTMTLGANHRVESASRPSSLIALDFDFNDEPGREYEDRPRFDRWLDAVAEAGLLPPEARPSELAERFFMDMRVAPGQGPPREMPALVQASVELHSGGWRGSGHPQVWGPLSFQMTLPLAAPVALVRARPLLARGGGIGIAACFGIDAALAARLAAISETRFEVTCEDLDERALDGLLRSVGADPMRVDWDCTWPGQGRYLNGVVLLANATEDPYGELDHVPGRSAVFLSLHPRVNDRRPGEFAVQLAQRAEVRLVSGSAPEGGRRAAR